MKAQPITHGWFRNTTYLQPGKSYWIYAGKKKHYLGHRTGNGWSWIQDDDDPKRKPLDGRPPEGTTFLAYREVDDSPFSPCNP